MRIPKKLPSPLSEAPFGVADANAAGVSPGQFRSGRLAAPYRGVRVLKRPQTTEERCSAYAVKMPPEQFFSHLTAAELYGFPLPYKLCNQPRVHVAVARPHYPPKGRGVVGHRLSRAPSPWTKGKLRALPPAETWCQLGSTLTRDELVVVGDYLVRRKRPLCTMDELSAAVIAAAHTPGIETVRAALGDIRPFTDSPRESELRLIIVRAGLPEPAIRHSVTSAEGMFIGTPDLAYVDEMVAIEYEGEHHRTDALTYENDIIRREQFEDAGWLVIRVTKSHLGGQHHRLIQRIERALRERAR